MESKINKKGNETGVFRKGVVPAIIFMLVTINTIALGLLINRVYSIPTNLNCYSSPSQEVDLSGINSQLNELENNIENLQSDESIKNSDIQDQLKSINNQVFNISTTVDMIDLKLY